MSDDGYIPAATIAEMSLPHPPGTRHAAMFKIAIPLLGNGLPAEAVFQTLRQKFPDADKTDKEIWDVVRWSQEQNPTPSGYGSKSNGNGSPARFGGSGGRFVPNGHSVTPKKAPRELVSELVAGAGVAEVDWSEKSPVNLWDGPNHAELLVSHLYSPEEFINVVIEFTEADDKDGGRKANPYGSGKIMTRDQWIARFQERPAPCSKAGAWVRPNPTKAEGSGKGGAVKDEDIASHRFLLIESDILSVEEQLAVYSRLPLPIAALIASGGGSVHAWLKVDAKDAEDYERIMHRIYAVTEPLGFDRSNKNPSRLSRLPGVKRVIGAKGSGEQRLIYLNPSPEPLNLDKLEWVAKPCPGFIRGSEMTDRIIEFNKPKPKPFTLPFMEGRDQIRFLDGFYFRDSEVTIWSGVSSHGKSTMLGTIMCHLMARKVPIFICSLEHRFESLCSTTLQIALGKPPSEENIRKFQAINGPLYSGADQVGSIAPQRLLDMMRSAHHREGAKHFFIDSLMRVEGMEEEYPLQGEFMTELTKVAMETKGHVHLVAHPRKVDENLRVGKMDVKGSVALVQGAFNVVTMRRNLEKKDAYERGASSIELAKMYDAEFSVEKQNASGWTGAFKLAFDTSTKQFSRFNPDDNLKPILDANE